MQLWMEINVTLHKVVETMPQQMRSAIKAKGSPTKYIFFGTGSVFHIKYVFYLFPNVVFLLMIVN